MTVFSEKWRFLKNVRNWILVVGKDVLVVGKMFWLLGKMLLGKKLVVVGGAVIFNTYSTGAGTEERTGRRIAFVCSKAM